jgi:hypothetical protein
MTAPIYSRTRLKNSSPATLRNVVLTMNLPHQTILGNSTLDGFGMPSTSFSRRFKMSGVGGSIIEWQVAKIDPQDYFVFNVSFKVAADVSNPLCGTFTATATGKTPKRKSFCLTVRRA